jgi:hypothetical protein
MKKHYQLFVFAWTIVVLAMVQPVMSQNRYPGGWTKVRIQGTALVEDFDFKDSVSGIEWDALGIEFSNDGGHSWKVDTALTANLGDNLGAKVYLNSVEATGASHGIIHPLDGTVVISPFSTNVFDPTSNGTGPYITIAEHMNDTATGYRLIQPTGRGEQPEDSVYFLVSHDAWQTSQQYGAAYTWTGPFDMWSSSINFYAGTMIDSNEAWTANLNVILHTTDAGNHWNSILPVDTTKYKPIWKDFFVNPSTHEIFAEGSSGPIDFAYSSDYGSTWRLDSTFHAQRLWRMAVPESGVIWGMVGTGTANTEITPGTPGEFCNTVVYSTDYGVSWYVDSTTFKNDSLVEIHFLDSRHGRIAGNDYYNIDSHIWYYDADLINAVNTPSVSDEILSVFPNPSTSFLNVKSSDPILTIIDPLGRSYSVPRNGSTIDVSALPSGVYFISDGHSRAKFVKE